MRTFALCLIAFGLLGAAIMPFLGIPSEPRPIRPVRFHALSPAAAAVAKERRTGDRLYAKADYRVAEGVYLDLVERHRGSPDPEVEEEVGAARLRLGYISAKRNDFVQSRARFLEAAEQYRGEPRPGGEFGSVPDQAAYQAAATLNLQGKTQEAAHAFRDFIKRYPLSPLVHGAYKRLAKSNGGKATAKDDALLQAAVRKQEERARFEMSVCGPKCVEYLLKGLNMPPKGYKQLAVLCGTTDHGTTIEGLRAGMKTVGLTSGALRVNRKDFDALPVPFIWLAGDHYVVVVEIGRDFVNVFDTLQGGLATRQVSPKDDTDFLADVITLAAPRLGGQ